MRRYVQYHRPGSRRRRRRGRELFLIGIAGFSLLCGLLILWAAGDAPVTVTQSSPPSQQPPRNAAAAEGLERIERAERELMDNYVRAKMELERARRAWRSAHPKASDEDASSY